MPRPFAGCWSLARARCLREAGEGGDSAGRDFGVSVACVDIRSLGRDEAVRRVGEGVANFLDKGDFVPALAVGLPTTAVCCADAAADGNPFAEPVPAVPWPLTTTAATPSTSTASSKPADGVGSLLIGSVNLSKARRSTLADYISGRRRRGWSGNQRAHCGDDGYDPSVQR